MRHVTMQVIVENFGHPSINSQNFTIFDSKKASSIHSTDDFENFNAFKKISDT